MAVHWSWAWGQETVTDLVDDMGFAQASAGGTQQPTSAAGNTYTYPLSPTRYAWETSNTKTLQTPTQAFLNAGTIAVPLKATAWYGGFSWGILVGVVDAAAGKNITVYCTNGATNVISLYVDNILGGTTTLTVNDWHYVALQYDMSGASWTGALYVDGVLKISGADTVSGATAGYFQAGGFGSNGYMGQLIVYTTGTVIADASAPIYCTRLSPQNDISDVGAWTPAANAGTDAVAAVISNDPLNTATNTTLSPAASSDNMITQATGINALIGVLSGDIRGVTAHSYASGTAVNTRVAVSGNLVSGGYTTGTQITPDTADTTYAFATYDEGSAAISSTGDIYFKYEIV